MKIDEARILFQAGSIIGADVARAPMGDRWVISFQLKPGVRIEGVTHQLIAARGNPREFSDLDRAVKALHDIGIEKVTVHK
jgi:hypothetical protein